MREIGTWAEESEERTGVAIEGRRGWGRNSLRWVKEARLEMSGEGARVVTMVEGDNSYSEK